MSAPRSHPRSGNQPPENGLGAQPYLDARQAAAQLNVTLPTLYAYVSRGLIRSEAERHGKRSRRYRAADIERIQARKEARRNPAIAAEKSLTWGMPVLDSAITLLDDGRLYYRGHDAIELAQRRTIEEVANLIWLERLTLPPAEFFNHLQTPALPHDCSKILGPIELMQAALPLAAAADKRSYDLRRHSVARTGARIMRLFAFVIAGTTNPNDSIAQILQRRWMPREPDSCGMLNMALVLCADHELNVSSFTARCVASAAATPYDVVVAGLAALKGTRHGGASARVEALFTEVGSPRRARRVITSRLQRGEALPGFGHPLYPQGDPRARLLLEAISRRDTRDGELVQIIVGQVQNLVDIEPNLDFALAALAATMGLPAGSPLQLFALGRTAGWIGHAIEQYRSERLIRPRARYVGALPHPPG